MSRLVTDDVYAVADIDVSRLSRAQRAQVDTVVQAMLAGVLTADEGERLLADSGPGGVVVEATRRLGGHRG